MKSKSAFHFVLVIFYMKSRGHRLIVDTCANEAIPQWGKHDLISHVYLQHHGHDEGDVQTLVLGLALSFSKLFASSS